MVVGGLCRARVARLCLLVAPRLWRAATEHDFYTTGDYLEFRYGTSVRCVASLLVGLGTPALLAGQLIAGAAILNVLTGVPRWAGALIGGGIMTVYFTAGGLIGSARVNILQLAVMMTGFALALRSRSDESAASGRLVERRCRRRSSTSRTQPGLVPAGRCWCCSRRRSSSLRDHPEVMGRPQRTCAAYRIALNAGVLMLFAFVPVVMGMIARVAMPGIESGDAVLPRVLLEQLPVWLGALALAAVFSTEVDTCDAILFMISTSASKDLYKRFLVLMPAMRSCSAWRA